MDLLHLIDIEMTEVEFLFELFSQLLFINFYKKIDLNIKCKQNFDYTIFRLPPEPARYFLSGKNYKTDVLITS